MRWMVFFVLVLNLVVFVWFSSQAGVNQSRNSASPAFDFSSAEPLVLLGEIPAVDLNSRDMRRSSPKFVGVQNSEVGVDSNYDDSLCSLVGPFLEVISVKQAKNRLEDKGLSSKTVFILKALPVINWVYIPPLPDRKKALEMLKDLQSHNVDSFLIADGDFRNGISLGFFSSTEAAKLVLIEREKQGYPVRLMEKKREQKTYWLAFDSVVTSKLTEERLKSLEEGSFVVKKQEKDCADVALLPIIE